MSTVRSAVPVEKPAPVSNPEFSDPFLPFLWTNSRDEELVGRVGSLLNVFSRIVLRSKTLPSASDLQLVVQNASGDRYEDAENRLRAACDADVHPVITEIGATLNRFIRGHLSPQFLPGSPEWRKNLQGFTRVLMDLLNARVAAEMANRAKQTKGQGDAPEDMARLCTRLLPKVADLQADLKLLAEFVRRQDGIEAGVIRQNFVVPLEKLHRFVEKRIKD